MTVVDAYLKQRDALGGRFVEQTDLYRFFDESGSLLYVGISISALGRAAAHRKRSGWWALAASMTIEHLDSREEALEAERTAIRNEKPRFNVVHSLAVQTVFGTGTISLTDLAYRMDVSPRSMGRMLAADGYAIHEGDDREPFVECCDAEAWWMEVVERFDRLSDARAQTAAEQAYYWDISLAESIREGRGREALRRRPRWLPPPNLPPDVELPISPRCSATTSTGRPCKLYCIVGQATCHLHEGEAS